jgi:hypothetical protein
MLGDMKRKIAVLRDGRQYVIQIVVEVNDQNVVIQNEYLIQSNEEDIVYTFYKPM